MLRLLLVTLVTAFPFREQSLLNLPSLHHDNDYQYFGTSFIRDKDRECTETSSIDVVQRHTLASPTNVVVITKPQFQAQGESSDQELITLIGVSKEQVEYAVDAHCDFVITSFEEQDMVSEEVIPIKVTGPPKNRIDVVFMGDGYTTSERGKFIADVTRLAEEMWAGETFEAVLPLFNIWAVFRPSKDSGIGVGGNPKDTSFGLYRDGTELRGIYPSKASAARAACKATGQYACDFPSIIANDDFYGGLGGVSLS
jgi:IgA Peptidase M64